MAISAVLAVTESSVLSQQPVDFVVTLTNGEASSVTYDKAEAFAVNGAPATLSLIQSGDQIASAIVAASGTLALPFGGSFLAGPQQHNIEATTVQAAFPVYVAGRVLDANGDPLLFVSNTVTVQVTPILQASTLVSSPGAMSFDSNNNSALFAALL